MINGNVLSNVYQTYRPTYLSYKWTNIWVSGSFTIIPLQGIYNSVNSVTHYKLAAENQSEH